MKVIVNADDLGLSADVNAAIFDLMARGRVTSATIMANGMAVEDAARRAKEFPGCSFGVHLNADDLRPLTANPNLNPILDRDGCMRGNAVRETKITPALGQAVYQELCAQVEKVQSLGVRISHFDSHHHVHTVPGIFPVLKRLQRKFGVRKVRATMNIYCCRVPGSPVLLLKKTAWNFALRNYFRTTATDGFTSLQIFAEAAREKKLRHTSVELMVHPGGKDFAEETSMLGTEWWRKISLPVELINYHQL